MVGTRFIAVMVVAALAASACGGGSASDTSDASSTAAAPAADAESTGDAPAPEPADGSVVIVMTAELEQVATALEDAHGEKPALEALLRALERGYTYDQIRTGALGGKVQLDGRIIGGDGELSPTGGRAGVLLLDDDPGEGEGASGKSAIGEPMARLRFQDDGIDQEALQAVLLMLAPLPVQLRDLADDPIGPDRVSPGKALTIAILALGRSGYTLDQIIEVIVLGTGQVNVLDNGCVAILAGDIVQPNGSFEGECTTGTAPPADESAAPETSEPAVQSEPAEEAASGATITGTFGAFPFLADFEGQPLTEVLENQFVVDPSGEVPVVSAIFRYLSPTDNYTDSVEVFCEFEGIIEVAEAPIGEAAFNGEAWTGQVLLQGSQRDGTCTAGSIDPEGVAGGGELTLTLEGTSMNGTIDFGGGLIWPVSGGLPS